MNNSIIPTNVVGCILTNDYCEIRTSPTAAYSSTRIHPVPDENGQYQEGAEWTEQFRERMVACIVQFKMRVPDPYTEPTAE